MHPSWPELSLLAVPLIAVIFAAFLAFRRAWVTPTTTRPEAKTVGWGLWILGVAAPIACIVFDFATGEYVLLFAPAALLSLAVIGVASVVVSRNQRQSVAGLATVGPMWAAGGMTSLLSIPLGAVGFLALLASVSSLAARPAFALLSFAYAVFVGVAPFITGQIYLEEARALTSDQAARHGWPRTVLVAFFGAAAAFSIVIGAQIMDSRWVNSQVAALNKGDPETLQTALRSLNAHPLCLRKRCRREVCTRLIDQFPRAGWRNLSERPDIPEPIASAFQQAFGVSVGEACRDW